MRSMRRLSLLFVALSMIYAAWQRSALTWQSAWTRKLSTTVLGRAGDFLPRRTMHIILDFDGTITVDDTIDNLAAFAVCFQERHQGGHSVADNSGEWARTWQAVVDGYLADHQDHRAKYAIPEHARTRLENELDYLRSLRAIDCRSIQTLRDTGLFAGLADRLADAGRQAVVAAAAKDAARAAGDGDSSAARDKMDGVRVRSGFAEFLCEMTTRRKWPVSVVSINWSDAWIRGVLAGLQTGQCGGANPDAVTQVFANMITESGAIVPNFARKHDVDQRGLMVGHDDNIPVASSSDKLEAMEVAAESAEAKAHGDTQIREPMPLVYMGDATTDIECLLRAAQDPSGGGGIVIADGDGPSTSKLLKTLARLGYSVPHVSEAESFQRRQSVNESHGIPRLAWAHDFDEILSSDVLG